MDNNESPISQNRSKLHYGYLIFAAMCCNSFAAFLSVYAGIIALPLTNELGESRGAVMQYMLCFALAFILFSPVWGHLHANKKIPIKLVMGIAVSCQMAAILLFATSHSLWQIYLAGFFMGLTSQGVFFIPNNVFASSWFSDNVRGRFLGGAYCFAGVAAFVLPPALQIGINAFGWRMALLAFAVMSACFMIPWCFAYVRTPEEKGLKPLGEPVNVGSKSQDDPEGKHGVSLKRIFRSPVFYLLLFSTMCISIMQGYENSFPAIADEGLTNTVYAASAMTFAAVMLSVDGLFDLFGALLAGTVIDKIGIKAATRIWALILLVMFISLIWFRDVPLGLYVGGACFGAQTCIRRSIIPLITRQIFGPRNFAKTIGYISVGTGVVNGVSSTFIAYSYDLTSGYQLALQTGFVIAICAAILLVTCLFFIGKYAWTTVEEEILGS